MHTYAEIAPLQYELFKFVTLTAEQNQAPNEIASTGFDGLLRYANWKKEDVDNADSSDDDDGEDDDDEDKVKLYPNTTVNDLPPPPPPPPPPPAPKPV